MYHRYTKWLQCKTLVVEFNRLPGIGWVGIAIIVEVANIAKLSLSLYMLYKTNTADPGIIPTEEGDYKIKEDAVVYVGY